MSAPVVGMVGAGQLARMTHQAAIDLGLRLRVLAESPGDPAVLAGASFRIGRSDSLDDLRAFAAECDIVTFDHEIVPPEHLAALEADGHVLQPTAAALRFAQDKLHARRTLLARGFAVPPFLAVASAGEVGRFAACFGWPVVLKTATGGYDGRGVEIVHGPEQAAAVLERWAGREILAEACLSIDAELAILVARRPSGEAVVYPAVLTRQLDGMCRELAMPAPLPDRIARRAHEMALSLAEAIGATGILAVELFLCGDTLVVNEVALRPHNSGHAAIEGCTTSQFENHLRAVLDWPLGAAALRAPAAATVNVVGRLGSVAQALAVSGASLHVYEKSDRPGRKLGHVTALGEDIEQALGVARDAANRLEAVAS